LLAREREQITAKAGAEAGTPSSPWDAQDGFQLSGTRVVARRVLVDDAEMTASVAYRPDGPVVSIAGTVAALDATMVEAGDAVYVLRHGRQTIVRLAQAELNESGGQAGGVVTAPMHGKLLAVLVHAGDAVRKGQRVAILEAMKMEHALVASVDGTIAEVLVSAGKQVAERAAVLIITPQQP
jgi:3-methylcrotonyl-CoA carboxylase alpha subunit